jgi:hypothetical protein
MRTPKKALMLVAAACATAIPSTASAATVSVTPASTEGDQDAMVYTAAAGEANDVTVSHLDAKRIRVTDPGAVDAHTAVCTGPGDDLTYAIVETLDLDDTIRSQGNAPPVPDPALVALGGDGADKLFGGAVGDELDGGAGRDEIDGGDGADVLNDGDADTLDPVADVLDGGPGKDLADYSGRRTAFRLDLRAAVTVPGEGDVLTEVEDVQGGSVIDRLLGDGAANDLFGGRGDDRLYGREGDDYLRGGVGADSAYCGSGEDIAFASQKADFVSADCEAVAFESGDVTYGFDPYPDKRSRRAVTFRLGCPTFIAIDRAPRCRGKLLLRQTDGSRALVGRGTIAASGRQRAVRVALTPAGRRLAAQRAGVPVTVAATLRTTRGRHKTTVAYTIRLKTRG